MERASAKSSASTKKLGIEEALLQIPNDPALARLILTGERTKNGEVKSQDRSGGLHLLAARLGEIGATAEVAESVIRYADARWGKYSTRPDAEDQFSNLFATVESKRSRVGFLGLVPLTIDELVDTAPPAEWLIEGLLLESQYGLVTGGTGVGKTQLALQLGLSVSAGMEWLGFSIPTAKSVCYVSVEMSHAEIAWFVKQMRQGLSYNDLPFRMLPYGQTISILTEDGKRFYRSLAEEFDVLIIDTLGASTHTSLSDEEAARGIVDFFGELKATGSTLLVVHHDSKASGANTQSRTEDAYGSRLFADRASTVLRLSKPKVDRNGAKIEGTLLEFSKIRLAPEPDIMLLQRTENLWYTAADFEVTVTGLPGGKTSAKRKSKPGMDTGLF